MPTNRRHSLSSGDESFYPHPAKADGLPRPDSRRRARLPRSKSTSNVFDAFSRPPGTTDHDTRNIALEQADIATLRELATFLRTTGPPPDRPATYDECLGLSSSGEPRRWSFQSFRRNKRMKLQRHSSQPHLPHNVIPGTTVEGHRYIAISTPALENSNVRGPWFRSQYPVFLPRSQSSSPPAGPTSGPGARLERNSSKVALGSNSEKRSTLGDVKHVHHSTARSIDKYSSPRSPVPEGARSRALSNRISTDQLLRAMLNPVEEGFEHHLGASLEKLGSRRAPGMEQAQIQIQPLMVVHEEEADKPEDHQQTASPHILSLTKSSNDDIGSQSPSSSHQSRDSPHSPGKSSRRPGNIIVQGNLDVPKKNILPESPGFPNMLATISFPSPPKGSRPSSPSSTAPSITDSQASLGSRPLVQPRTSSRRACASTSVSAASLDGIVVQKRPNSRLAKSDRTICASTVASSGTTTVDACAGSSHPPTVSAKQSNSSEHLIRDEADYGLTEPAGSPGLFCKRLGVRSYGSGEESQRQSLASQFTATTNYSRHSILTCSSSLSSSASEMSTQSTATITVSRPHSSANQNSDHIHPPISEGYANAEDKAVKSTGIGKDDVGLIEIDKTTGSTLRLSTTPDLDAETDLQPKSILERRLARKAKVREYKMRDLDASRADIVDSPILGYFAPNLPGGPDPAAEGPLAPINGVRRSSMLSMATAISEASNEPLANTDTQASAHLHHHVPFIEDQSLVHPAVEVTPVPIVQLKISAVVATDIEPVYPTTPHWHTSGITMSPIMVVADVESRPGSPTLRFSALARPDSSSLRTVARLKPIKISSHSRQKSHTVTISRNPATGAIERSASGPIDPKFNRRSLMTMPTPPLSPEATQLPRKRYSLPPVQLNLPITHQDRPSPSRSQEWHSSYTEEGGPDNRLRDMVSLRERVMREKLQKEKEITDIVAKTVGLPQKQSAYEDDQDSVSPEQNNAETLENRLSRLERTNDAWLCAMKPLLETMARTLDDMRVDDRCRSLRMSDFVIDAEVEANRVTHNRRGEKDKTNMALQGSSSVASGATKIMYAARPTSTTPLSPILQELEDSPEGPSGNDEASPTMQKQGMPIQDETCKANIQTTEAAGSGSVGRVEESSDWSDLGPLIRELASMPRNSQEEPVAREVVGTRGSSSNGLNPLMRDLMSASRLCAEEVRGAR